jgi:rhodanese-related sulfurtransferase
MSNGGEIMVKDITAEELKGWIAAGRDFILIDARDPGDHKDGHIPGAISLMLSEIEKKESEMLEKEKDIVAYSKDINCPASGLVSKKLDELGYISVYNYDPSYADWVSKGYPIEK